MKEWTILKSYWLTVLGSIVLVTSWYFEKVLTQKHEGEIARLDHSIREFADAMNLVRTMEHITDRTDYKTTYPIQLKNNHSGLAETIIAIAELHQLSFQLVYGNENLPDSISDKVDSLKSLTTRLYQQNNFDSILNLYQICRNDVSDATLVNQTQYLDLVEQERESLSTIRLVALLCYIIGILLVTIEKVKRVIRPPKNLEHDEVLARLKIIEINTEHTIPFSPY